MRTHWAGRTIALAILIFSAATNATQAQFASGPQAMPPMSPGYGMAPASGYASAPGWGYATPAAYGMAGPAQSYQYAEGAGSYSDGMAMGAAYGGCGDAGCGDCGIGGCGIGGGGHHKWFGNGHLMAGLGAVAGLLLPYSEGGCCAPHWFDIHAEAVFLQRDQISRYVPFSSEGFALSLIHI